METGFLTHQVRAECEVGPRGDVWTLTEDLVACWRGTRIVVRAGYPTDGASIPRFAWAVIGHPWDSYLPAAIVHDVLYASEVWKRQVSDQCFHDLMHALLVRTVRLHAMYWSVRLFGGTTWRRHTLKSVAHAQAHLEITPRCQSIDGARSVTARDIGAVNRLRDLVVCINRQMLTACVMADHLDIPSDQRAALSAAFGDAKAFGWNLSDALYLCAKDMERLLAAQGRPVREEN